MPGLSDMLGVLEIKEMRGRPRQAEAREMLEKLRDQVRVSHEIKRAWRACVGSGTYLRAFAVR